MAQKAFKRSLWYGSETGGSVGQDCFSLVRLQFRGLLGVQEFDLGCDLRGLLQHCRDGTILFLRETNRVLDRLARHFAPDAIGKLDFGVDGWRIRSTLGLGANLDASKGLALFSQDGDDIVGRATAQADENQFHVTVACSFIALDDDSVSAAGSAVKAMILNPASFGFSHSEPRLMNPRLRPWPLIVFDGCVIHECSLQAGIRES